MANRFWVGGTATWNTTAGTKWATTSGGAGGASVPTASDDVFFDANSGSGTVTLGTGVACKSMDCDGFTGTWVGAVSITVSGGGWRWGSGMTQNWTGGVTFADTSGVTQTITSNGKQFKGSVGFNGVGGSWQLADNINVALILFITNGTFDTNAKSVTTGTLSSSGTSVRSLLMSNSYVTITGSGTVWNFATSTNAMVVSTGATVEFTDASANLKLIQLGSLVYDHDVILSGSGTGTYQINGAATIRDLYVNNTSNAQFHIHNASTYRNVTFGSGYTGTWTDDGPRQVVTGNIVFASGMTVTNTGTLDMYGSGTQLITSNGVSLATLGLVVGFNGTPTVKPTDTLIVGFLEVENGGTFDDNGKSVTTGYLSMGAVVPLGGTIVSSIPWTINGTGVNPRTGLALDVVYIGGGTFTTPISLNLTGTDVNAKGFIGGGLHYDTITWSGSGAFIIKDSNSFTKVTLNSLDSVMHLGAGTTNIISNVTGLTGAANSVNVIKSDTSGVLATLKHVNNFAQINWVALQDVQLAGGAFWYVGKNSVNNGNTPGARFTDGLVGRAS